MQSVLEHRGHSAPRGKPLSCLRMTLRSPLVAVCVGRYRRRRKRILSHRWALQAYSSQFRRTPRGGRPGGQRRERAPTGSQFWPIGEHPLRPDNSRLNESGESLVRIFLRATKVAEGHACESGVNPRPWEPSPPQRLVGSPQAVSKLHGTRRSAVASIKAEADRRAANVLPIIREAQ
jgi:hypothetical protein